MLTKCNVGLVIDANTIIDIAAACSGNRLTLILQGWLAAVIDRIDAPTRGRAITLFVSSGIQKDYATGLGHARHDAAKTLRLDIKKIITRSVRLRSRDRNRFLVRKLDPAGPGSSPRAGDKYDQAYLDILAHISDCGLWRDRAVIFATKDAGLLADLQDGAARAGATSLRFAGGKNDLEDEIAC